MLTDTSIISPDNNIITPNDKVIVTDCDGVLTDWATPFKIWMERKGYTVKKPGIYNLHEAYDMNCRECVIGFNESDAIGELKSMKEAEVYVKKLREKGYIFYVITSLSTSEKTQERRWQNLEDLFGKNTINGITFLPIETDKTEALRPHIGAKLWIEDHSVNAEAGQKLGIEAVLMNQSYNKNYNGTIPRVNNWAEIYNRLQNQSIEAREIVRR